MTTEFPTAGRYRHYKGQEYQVIDVARHSETEQWFVVYYPLYGQRSCWIRPLDMFCEEVLVNAEMIPRFQRIADR